MDFEKLLYVVAENAGAGRKMSSLPKNRLRWRSFLYILFW
jgi:hypothetical protein